MEEMVVEVSMEEVAPWSRLHSETGQKGEVVNNMSSGCLGFNTGSTADQ